MRMSGSLTRTLRDDPADAEADSHRLLVRAGYIRRTAAGIYTWLPLGVRVLRRIEAIVRDEMARAGAQEVSLPILQPLELWERTGRDVSYGPLMYLAYVPFTLVMPLKGLAWSSAHAATAAALTFDLGTVTCLYLAGASF